MSTSSTPREAQPELRANRYSHGMALMCPHCSTRCIIRTSRAISETYREAWAICAGCGFKGKAHTAWDAEASPSLRPSPSVRLPRLEYQEAVEQFAAEELAESDQTDLFLNTG